MGLQAEIWAWGLGEGGTKEKKEEEKKEEGKHRSTTPSEPLLKKDQNPKGRCTNW